jgi:hypothetical protein
MLALEVSAATAVLAGIKGNKAAKAHSTMVKKDFAGNKEPPYQVALAVRFDRDECTIQPCARPPCHPDRRMSPEDLHQE